jgi:hypothetical protein
MDVLTLGTAMVSRPMRTGVEWPFLSMWENESQDASTRDRVALAIVNVEFAGCNMPFSPAISPPGVPRATSVVSVVDGALHDAPS